jgi:hypothetical protein
MSMCVLALKYVQDVYSKPIHMYTSCTYFKANTHIDIWYIFQSQYTHIHLEHISKPIQALKYAWDVYVCISFEIYMRCLCVNWLWNMYEMSKCVLALKYVWFKANTHIDISYIFQSQYTCRNLIHISKLIHT